MAGRYPVTTGPKLIRALVRAGFIIERQEGSHVFLTHPARPQRVVCVSNHAGIDLKLRTLQNILRQAELTPEALRDLL